MQNTKGVRTVGQSTGLPKEGSVTSIFIDASTQPPLPYHLLMKLMMHTSIYRHYHYRQSLDAYNFVRLIKHF